MTFTQTLRAQAEPLWAAAAEHPFVSGIGDGTLPLDRFSFYIRQDYIFLIEFSRVLALAVARAGELQVMQQYASLLDTTLNQEMQLHRAFCARFGIGREALEATMPSPATHAYTRHLLHVAYSGTIAEITASLIPCMVGYAEIAAALAAQEEPASQPLYGEWIRTYAAPEFQQLADWLSTLLDRLAEQAGESERRAIARAFLTSSRYEFLFWEAAWEMRGWPI